MARKKVLQPDLSNRTVLVMTVVVLLVGLVSVGVYLDALSSAEPEVAFSSVGLLQLGVLEPGMSVSRPVHEGGRVGLTILR